MTRTDNINYPTHSDGTFAVDYQASDIFKPSNLIQRAYAPHSTIPRAFLRWVGSKRYLLPHIAGVLPPKFGTYFEPFLGSASLFFLLRPESAVLSDTCSELIDTYAAVRDNASAILRYLLPLKPKRSLFYKIRASRSTGRFKNAAEFIYLNKTCWNGLYRVNLAGQFNVPYGRPKTDGLIDAHNLRACSDVLAMPKISIEVGDFEKAIHNAQRGDLVYLDPPYVTGHRDNGFVEYNEKIFSWHDQVRLARAATSLAARGVHVVVSNADHSSIDALYCGFRRTVVSRHSTLASNKAKRRVISEVIFFTAHR